MNDTTVSICSVPSCRLGRLQIRQSWVDVQRRVNTSGFDLWSTNRLSHGTQNILSKVVALHHEQSSYTYCALLNIMTPHICAWRPTYRSVWTQMAEQQKELITGASTAKKTIKFGLSSHASQQHFLCHHMIWQTRDDYPTWLVPYFEPLRYPPPLLQNCLQLAPSTRPQSRHEMCNEAFVSAYVSVYGAQHVGVWCVCVHYIQQIRAWERCKVPTDRVKVVANCHG